jgi:hypothetical protein
MIQEVLAQKQRISRPNLSNFSGQGKFLDLFQVIPEFLERSAHCSTEQSEVRIETNAGPAVHRLSSTVTKRR